MTLTLLDLYNTAASQEWSMYDNDAASEEEFEDSLVLALNKAITEIYTSYDFPFRERVHVILTLPGTCAYDLPNGLIKKDSHGKYMVKLNSKFLDLIKNPESLKHKCGIPEGFYIKGDKIVLYPFPVVKSIVTIDYSTLSIGETANGEEIYTLKNQDDILSVPPHLEVLMKDAVITKAMINSIASESDENYSAYKRQADKAYRLLVKYAKALDIDKRIVQ